MAKGHHKDGRKPHSFSITIKDIKLWLESHLPRQKMPADKDISSIMDIIINANGFEDAVEAVLRLKTGNGWLIKDFSNALKILRQSFLKEPFSLVLRDLPDPQSSLPQDPKKYLLSLIQIREGCLPLGKRLFGNVIVVQTLTQDLLNLHPNIIFVTPKGEILTSEGVIHKGYSQGILKEYLSQKKLYIHLQKKVGILKRHLSQVRTRFKTLKIELTQLEKLLKENEIEVEKYKKQQDGIKEEEIQTKGIFKIHLFTKRRKPKKDK
ncbi:Chromosome partition protein Smc [Candidatus Methanoperedenaceae archaeon GB37]|nr:Chromosome partition protein Smc [Candidatus Methanoperedenaceae archaeon GB37]